MWFNSIYNDKQSGHWKIDLVYQNRPSEKNRPCVSTLSCGPSLIHKLSNSGALLG
ncbi:unnamed protein product [Arabidopsis halleri]